MKKMILGIMVTFIGLFFSGFSFVYAIINPWSFNGIDGLLGSFLGTNTLIPFSLGLVVMVAGLALCGKEAYGIHPSLFKKEEGTKKE